MLIYTYIMRTYCVELSKNKREKKDGEKQVMLNNTGFPSLSGGSCSLVSDPDFIYVHCWKARGT